MLVQREPRLPSIQAPSYSDCHKGVVDKEMSPLECCLQAIKSLTRIMQDLKDLSESTNESSDGISSDVNALLRLVSYFLYCPLWAAHRYFETLHNQIARDLISTDAARRQARRVTHFKKCWDDLYQWVLLALATSQPISNIPTEILQVASPHPMLVEVPSIGAVELLLRVVAEAQGSNDIGVYPKSLFSFVFAKS